MKQIMKQIVYAATLLFFITGSHHGMAQEHSFDYVPGEILVKYKSHISAANIAERHRQLGIRTKETFRRIRAHHLQLPAGLSVEEALEIYGGDSNVEYAEPNYFRYATATIPNDPDFAELWGLHNDSTDADIDAPEAWDIATDCSGIVIAVIDTGIDYDHEDLSGNIWSNPGEIPGDGIDDDGNGYIDDVRGWDFVGDDNDPMDTSRSGHGTHVAGTIAAEGDNGTGIAGVCWTAQIMPLRFLNDRGTGDVAGEIEAIQYAITKGARVINASFGSDEDEPSESERAAISDARDAGILFVAAAGNDGDYGLFYPAGHDLANIISVAATDQNDDLASFSNYGAAWVDVGAPGKDIYSTRPGDDYQDMSGTSMATPHVVGLAGLIWNKDPSLTHEDIKCVILNGVDAVDSLLGITVTGGRINAYNALSLLSVVRPSGLNAAPVSSNQVDLAWTEVYCWQWESDFEVERKLVGGSYSRIATVLDNTTTYIDTSANEGTSYVYRVRACNADGDSDYSNEANATTFPTAPTGLSATAVSSNQVNLTWEDNSSGESGFKIERKTGSAGTYAQIASVGADVTSFSNSGLSASTTYYYRVRAYNSGGDSTYSNEANATTLLPPPPPAAPTGLSATAVSSNQVNLTWEDNSSGESGFKIERKTGSAGTYAQIASVGADVTSFSNSGLSASTTYYYRVRAYNSGGDSTYSNEANATTAAAPPPASDDSDPAALPSATDGGDDSGDDGGGGGGGSCFISSSGSRVAHGAALQRAKRVR